MISFHDFTIFYSYDVWYIERFYKVFMLEIKKSEIIYKYYYIYICR